MTVAIAIDILMKCMHVFAVLGAVHPDELNAKQALDLIYNLKFILNTKN